MSAPWPTPIEGGCGCGHLRYRVEEPPMFIHCCNCQACQRENGSAFALNAFIETEKVTLLPPRDAAPDATAVQPLHILMPSHSGAGQLVARCPVCYTAVWSYFGGAGPSTCFIKVGTVDKLGKDGKSLDEVLRPDVYIHTKSKMPWVEFPKDQMEFEEFYKPADVWPKDIMERWTKMTPELEKWQKSKDWTKYDLQIDVDATKEGKKIESLEETTKDLSLDEKK